VSYEDIKSVAHPVPATPRADDFRAESKASNTDSIVDEIAGSACRTCIRHVKDSHENTKTRKRTKDGV
jgi:hypothetical protein